MIQYFAIPLLVFATGAIGSKFTNEGLKDWYQTLNKPSITPPGSVIGVVWTVLYILLAVSMVIFWNKVNHESKRFWLVITVFILNLVLNALWSYLFFAAHNLSAAIWDAVVLALSVIVMIYFVWPTSKLAAYLLIPYVLWTSFATYLTYVTWTLNR